MSEIGVIVFYFVIFVVVLINDIFGKISDAEVEIFREIFSWTDILIASAGYGICRRLDIIIKKNK